MGLTPMVEADIGSGGWHIGSMPSTDYLCGKREILLVNDDEVVFEDCFLF